MSMSRLNASFHAGNVTSCDALYMYSPLNGSLRAIEITWKPILVRILDVQ